ncbi:MAG: serine hydrolase, partial [Acidobacteriota bacterium]
MKKCQVCFMILVLTGWVSLLVAQANPPEVQPLTQNPEVSAAIKVLDAWIAAKVAGREQPGLSIGIVYDQDLIWAKGYGFADLAGKVPATPSTLYFSVSQFLRSELAIQHVII